MASRKLSLQASVNSSGDLAEATQGLSGFGAARRASSGPAPDSLQSADSSSESKDEDSQTLAGPRSGSGGSRAGSRTRRTVRNLPSAAPTTPDSPGYVKIDPRRPLPRTVQQSDGKSVYRRGAMMSDIKRDGATQIQFEREDGMPLDVISLPESLVQTLPKAYQSYVDHLASQELRMTAPDLQTFHMLYRGHVVHARKLNGGFKSSVWACTSTDQHGHACVPTIAKFAPADELRVEHDRHVMLQYVLADSVPRILKFVQRGNVSAMCMTNEKSGQSFETVFLSAQSIAHVNLVLDQLFGRTLHRLYREATPGQLNLYEYYFMKPVNEQELRVNGAFLADHLQSKLPMMLGVDDELTPKVRRMIEHDSVPLDVRVVGESAEYLKNFLMFGPVCYAKTREKIQIKALLQPVHVVPIVTTAFERAAKDPSVRKVFNTTLGFVHGDLNARNILVKSRDRIALIDFDHVHRGHSLRDFAKLENDIMFVLTPIENDADLGEALEITMFIAGIDDLTVPLPHSLPGVTKEPIVRAWLTIVRLREWVAQMQMCEDSARDYKMALLAYAGKSLSFRDNSAYQRLWALASASLLAHIVFSGAEGPTSTLIAPVSKAAADAQAALQDGDDDGDAAETKDDWQECSQHDIKLLFFYLQHENVGHVRKQDLALAIQILLTDHEDGGAISSAKIEGDTADRWVKRKHNAAFDFTAFQTFLDVEHLDRAGIVIPLIRISTAIYLQSRVAEDSAFPQRVGSAGGRGLLTRRNQMLVAHLLVFFIVSRFLLRAAKLRLVAFVHGSRLFRRGHRRRGSVMDEPSFRWFVEGDTGNKASAAQAATPASSHKAHTTALLREVTVTRNRRDMYFVAMLVPYVCLILSVLLSVLSDRRQSLIDTYAEELMAPIVVYGVLAVLVSTVSEKRTVFTLHNTLHLKSYELLLPVDTQKVSSAYHVAKQLVDRWRAARESPHLDSYLIRRFNLTRSKTPMGSLVSSGALHMSMQRFALTLLLPLCWALVWPLARTTTPDTLDDSMDTVVVALAGVAAYVLMLVSLLLLVSAGAQVERVLAFFDNFTALTSLRSSSVQRLPYVPLDRVVNVHGWMQLREFVMGYFTRGNPFRLAVPISLAKNCIVASVLVLVVAWRLLSKSDETDSDYTATHVAVIHMLVGVLIVALYSFPVLVTATNIADRIKLTTAELQRVEYDLQLRALHVSQVQHYSPEECAQMRECAALARIAIRVAEQDNRLPTIFGLELGVSSVAMLQLPLLVVFVLVFRLVRLEVLLP